MSSPHGTIGPTITIDCPFCDGAATTDDGLTDVCCDGCDVLVGIAPDQAPALLAAA